MTSKTIWLIAQKALTVAKLVRFNERKNYMQKSDVLIIILGIILSIIYLPIYIVVNIVTLPVTYVLKCIDKICDALLGYPII